MRRRLPSRPSACQGVWRRHRAVESKLNGGNSSRSCPSASNEATADNSIPPGVVTPHCPTRTHTENHIVQQLIPLTKPEQAKAAGIPVETVDQLRWLERTADAKGLREAFVRIGRRVFLDPEKFHELVRSQTE